MTQNANVGCGRLGPSRGIAKIAIFRRGEGVNPSAVFRATMVLGHVVPTLTMPPYRLFHALSRLSRVYWYYIHLP